MQNTKEIAVKGSDFLVTLASQMGVSLPTEEWAKPEFVAPSFKNEFIANFDETKYHADTTAISRSDILAYLKSPAHFVARRQELAVEEKDSNHFRFGRLMHSMFLEPERFMKNCVLIPEFVGLTKDGRPSTLSAEAKEKKKKFFDELDPAAMACSKDELIQLFGIARAFAKNEEACNLLFRAEMEMTGYFRDPVTGLKIRFRTDFLNDEIEALGDLKSSNSSAKSDFERALSDYEYAIQIALYSFGFKTIRGKAPRFNPFIVIEKTRPFPVQVYTPKERALKLAEADIRYALDGIAKGLETNEWPTYFNTAQDVDHAEWYYKKRELGLR